MLAQYLDLYLQGSPLPIRPPTALERTTRWLQAEPGRRRTDRDERNCVVLGAVLVMTLAARSTRSSAGPHSLLMLAVGFALGSGNTAVVLGAMALRWSVRDAIVARRKRQAELVEQEEGFRRLERVALSSQTIVTLYPTPMAHPYQQFLGETDAKTRLDALFLAVEATMRYLTLIAASDLLQCLSRRAQPVPADGVFDFLRRTVPLTLGGWRDALRETARALATHDERFVRELPEICGAGGRVVKLLGEIITRRNESAALTAARSPPPRLMTSSPRCARSWWKSFATSDSFASIPSASSANLSPTRHQGSYSLHSCMGAHVSQKVNYLATSTRLERETPFVVSSDGMRVLYLWPLLSERYTPEAGRHLVYVFKEIERNRSHLTGIRYAAVEALGCCTRAMAPADQRPRLASPGASQGVRQGGCVGTIGFVPDCYRRAGPRCSVKRSVTIASTPELAVGRSARSSAREIGAARSAPSKSSRSTTRCWRRNKASGFCRSSAASKARLPNFDAAASSPGSFGPTSRGRARSTMSCTFGTRWSTPTEATFQPGSIGEIATFRTAHRGRSLIFGARSWPSSVTWWRLSPSSTPWRTG